MRKFGAHNSSAKFPSTPSLTHVSLLLLPGPTRCVLALVLTLDGCEVFDKLILSKMFISFVKNNRVNWLFVLVAF